MVQTILSTQAQTTETSTSDRTYEIVRQSFAAVYGPGVHYKLSQLTRRRQTQHSQSEADLGGGSDLAQ